MGDMADYINSECGDDDGVYDYYPPQEDFSGPGKCPICGGKTHLVKNGKYGPFYGCNKYPTCTGSRGVEMGTNKIRRPKKKKSKGISTITPCCSGFSFGGQTKIKPTSLTRRFVRRMRAVLRVLIHGEDY